jgi:hypothetical protein
VAHDSSAAAGLIGRTLREWAVLSKAAGCHGARVRDFGLRLGRYLRTY